jgi:PDZ domain-containing protein
VAFYPYERHQVRSDNLARTALRVAFVTALWFLAALVLAVGIVVQAAPSPYSVVEPGTVLAIGPNLTLADEHQHETGWLALTSVRIRRASNGEWLLARLDPSRTLLSQTQLRPDGTTERDYVAIRKRWLESSKTTAAVVALREAGYPAAIRARGLLIERVRADAPAAEQLRAGDVIMHVGGQPVASSGDIGALLSEHEIGAPVRLGLLRDGRRLALSVPTMESPTEPGTPVLGVRVSPHVADAYLPITLEVKTERIMGSSAGLMLALGIYDALTAGDLAAGRRVAGTGTIDPDGRVGPIGSVAEKVAAAEREQAVLFLAPRENAEAATRAARQLRVVPVSTFDEALAALEQLDPETPLAAN